MVSAADVLKVAVAEIGTVEDPPGSNRVKYWAELDRNLQGQPWCAALVSWCFKQAGAPLPRIDKPYGFVYVPSAVAWARKHRRFHTTPQPGDVALYGQPGGLAVHTGIVESVGRGGNFTAIEGNTSLKDNTNGGQVMRRTRNLAWVVGFLRPDLEAASPAPAKPAPMPSRPPVVTEYPEDQLRSVNVVVKELDDKGNGWLLVPNTVAADVVSVIGLGSYPPVDGYWNLPAFGRQQRGNDTIIQISEADARAGAEFTVWFAER